MRERFINLKPGECEEVSEEGHVLHVTATDETGIHTGRRRHRVECLTCNILVHPSTTGPQSLIHYHLRNPDDAWPTYETTTPS